MKKKKAIEFIELVPTQDLKDPSIPKHFINHFPVWTDDPTATNKCRHIFDVSLHKKGKPALNYLMLKGSQLTPYILVILIRIH